MRRARGALWRHCSRCIADSGLPMRRYRAVQLWRRGGRLTYRAVRGSINIVLRAVIPCVDEVAIIVVLGRICWDGCSEQIHLRRAGAAARKPPRLFQWPRLLS